MIPQEWNYMKRRYRKRDTGKKRLYMEETIWEGNIKKRGLYGKGHYMGKVFYNEEGTI